MDKIMNEIGAFGKYTEKRINWLILIFHLNSLIEKISEIGCPYYWCYIKP